MPSQPHQPLGFRDLLAETLHTFWGNLRLYLTLMATFLLYLYLVSFIGVYAVATGASAVAFDPVEMWRNMSWLARGAIIGLYFSSFAVLLRVYAATVSVASEAHLGRTITFWQALGRTRRRGLRLLWVLFLINLFAAPTGLLAVPAVAVAVFFASAIPIGLLEDLNVSHALNRSSFLTKGGYGRVVLLILLCIIVCVAAVPAFLVFMGFAEGFGEPTQLWLRRFGVAAMFAVLVTLGQLLMTALTLNYYDQLVRKEQPVPSS